MCIWHTTDSIWWPWNLEGSPECCNWYLEARWLKAPTEAAKPVSTQTTAGDITNKAIAGDVPEGEVAGVVTDKTIAGDVTDVAESRPSKSRNISHQPWKAENMTLL
jgi:hypothetical protein